MRFSQFLPVTAIAAGLLAVPAVAQNPDHDELRAEIRKIIREELKAALKEAKKEQPGFGFTNQGLSTFVDTDKDGLPDARVAEVARPMFVRTPKSAQVDVKVDTDKIRKELQNVEVELRELDSLAKDIEKQVQTKVRARDAQKQSDKKTTKTNAGFDQFVVVDGKDGPATFHWTPKVDFKVEGFDGAQAPKAFAWRVADNTFMVPKVAMNNDGCCTITIRCENGACTVEVNGKQVEVHGNATKATKAAPKAAKEPKEPKAKKTKAQQPLLFLRAADNDDDEELLEVTFDDVTTAVEVGACEACPGTTLTVTGECCEVATSAANAEKAGNGECCCEGAEAKTKATGAGECCESGEAKAEKAGSGECCEGAETKAEAKAKPAGAGECCEGGCSGCAEEVKTEVKVEKKVEKSDKKAPTTVRRLLIGAR